jgi:ribonuclease Z
MLGLMLWFATEDVAGRFGVEAISVAGLSTLRADLGGLFVALAALCLAGAWKRQRAWLVAAIVLLGAVVGGRLVGLVAVGQSAGALRALAIELGAILILAIAVRTLPAGKPAPARRPRRVALLAFGLALLLAGGAAVFDDRLQSLMTRQVAAQRINHDGSGLLADDALRVAICGSSSPLPSADRAKACVAVMAGGRFYLVDVGPESVENLMEWGLPLDRIGGVLLTHFHSDHIGDLGELNLQTWARGRPAPLPVYGGPGVESVVEGFNRAYRLDQGYRTAHHSARLMPARSWPLVSRRVELPGAATPALSRTATVLQDGDLKITAIEMDHAPVTPAYAYRFDYKGRSVVVTGDARLHPPLAAAAAGTDILVSEAIARPMVDAMRDAAKASGRDRLAAIMDDIQDYHVSPQETAALANQAKARLLVYYHLIPAPDGFLARRAFADGVDQIRQGDWTIADDHSLYTLPIGSKTIRIGRVERSDD